MATFVIGPINTLTFKNRDDRNPNSENTLVCEENFDNVVIDPYNQKFLQSNNIVNQIRTNYDTDDAGTEIEATLVNSAKVQTPLVVEKVRQVTDPIVGKVIFYEFKTSGLPLDSYHIAIKAIKSGENNIYLESEPFEIVEGVKNFRYGIDGTIFEYEVIPNHFEILAFNNDNQPNTYWGKERITGDPFQISVWVPGVNYKVQPGGETDVYDNQGNLSKLKSIAQRTFELKTSAIPPHIALKVSELSDLDNFYINNKAFVSEEKPEIEYFGNFTSAVLTGNFTQANVVGLNSDDQGFIITDTDMASVENLVIENGSGSETLQFPGGYALNQITIQPIGADATVKIGTTVAGEEIMKSQTVTLAEVVKNKSRPYVNLINPDAGFTVYIDISGVGASAKVTLQTIINKQ